MRIYTALSTLLFLTCIVFLITGCNQSKNNSSNEIINGAQQKPHDSIIQKTNQPEKKINADDEKDPEPYFEPKPIYISENLLDIPTIKVSDPFQPEQILFKLFPGTYLNGMSNTPLAYWKNDETPVKYYTDWGWPEPNQRPVPFPRPGNQTMYLDTLNFINEKGENCLLYSISTSNDQGGFICGREFGAFLGLALFVKQDSIWVLKKYNPAVGCYGSFS